MYQSLKGPLNTPTMLVVEGAALKSAVSRAELLLNGPCLICAQRLPKLLKGFAPTVETYLILMTAERMTALSGRAAVLKDRMARY